MTLPPKREKNSVMWYIKFQSVGTDTRKKSLLAAPKQNTERGREVGESRMRGRRGGYKRRVREREGDEKEVERGGGEGKRRAEGRKTLSYDTEDMKENSRYRPRRQSHLFPLRESCLFWNQIEKDDKINQGAAVNDASTAHPANF